MPNPRDELQGMWKVTMARDGWTVSDLMFATAKLVEVVDKQAKEIRLLRSDFESLQAEVEKYRADKATTEYERLRRVDP